MASTVRIPWSREYDNVYKWNEVCAWAIEYFGLPGHRFETHANVNYMDFVFQSNKDALLMALKWNGEIVPEEQLTIDFLGSKLQ
jgi:hypothetical protein